MKFTIITHVPHIRHKDEYFAYSPYVREMNLWSEHVDSMLIVAPLSKSKFTAIDYAYKKQDISFSEVSDFSLLGVKAVFDTLFKMPGISWKIFKAMRQADHIHLRCPGNMGLLGCIVQIAFPSKPKSAKYAGNWDPKSRQPWSYKLQKWILGNTFLTRNTQVLVYGEWEGSSKNIKPFFTATYTEADKSTFDLAQDKRSEQLHSRTVRFLFVGTLSEGKRPLYAVQLVQQLHKKGHKVLLDLYGEGKERQVLEKYIRTNNLSEIICLRGNQTAETIKVCYQKSHFLLLPSKSEGWPKVVAEAMFWGCVPLVTPVSCVPYMLHYGKRGVLLEMDLQTDINKIYALLQNESEFLEKRKRAFDWSRNYTLDAFERDIKQILNYEAHHKNETI